MKNRRMRLMAIFAAGVLSVTSMGGIVTVHAGEALAVPADEAGVVQTDGSRRWQCGSFRGSDC